jgi:hypothetical protein
VCFFIENWKNALNIKARGEHAINAHIKIMMILFILIHSLPQKNIAIMDDSTEA